jgi:drug/metabolite transporter (DMT)-like permease
VSFGRNEFSSVGNISLLGIGLLVISNINSGYGNVLVARDAFNVPPLVLSSASMIIGGAVLFLISLPIEGLNFVGPKPFKFYASLAWLSFLSAAAISIWFTLLKRPGVKVSNLNFWKFLIPVTGALLAWIILPEEKPNNFAYGGMIVIALSLVLLNLHKRKYN